MSTLKEQKDFVSRLVFMKNEACKLGLPAGTQTILAFLENDPRGKIDG